MPLLYIDVKSEILGKVLKQIIQNFGLPFKRINILFNEKDKINFKNKIIGNSDPPIILIKEIFRSDLEQQAQKGFKENKHSSQHLLYYRNTYKEFEEVINKQDEITYSDYCFPILYLIDFNVVDYPHLAFIDSSIWHRSLNKYGDDFTVNLLSLLSNFVTWHEESLYKRIVTLETLDYHIRMLKERRLTVIDPKNENSGHANNINLSFRGIEGYYNNLFSAEKNKNILPRRFLLIDDYSNRELRKLSGENETEQTNNIESKRLLITNEDSTDVVDFSKTYYILKALKTIFDGNEFELYLSTNIEDALNLIKSGENHFDIILLDYLLGKNEKGTEFLLGLGKNFENYKEFTWIDKRYWIFPVSAFSFSMIAELASGKIQSFEQAYILHPGADPINTPELFRYSLWKFLERQQDEILKEMDEKYQWKEDSLLIFFLESLFKSESKSVKEQAKEGYRGFLNFRNLYGQITEKKDKGSLSAKSIFGGQSKSKSRSNNDILDHCHHLIYALAYEPSYEWSRMWDEFIIVRQKLREIFSQNEKEVYFLRRIENYIANLQEKAN